MNKEDLKTILQHFQKELFSFGYVLIPDELQVQQMVIDVINLIGVEGQYKKTILNVAKGEPWPAEDRFALKRDLFKNLYLMAKRRYTQIKESLEVEMKSEFAPFYALNFEERALLWFDLKSDLDVKDISHILGKKNTNLISSLAKSQNKLKQFHSGAL